ncbi:manganese efflux pump [Paenibacillus aceris]|uniref:Sporulation protein YtaF n=1 Tax=Paenibacillus aceris TaxID=869555 RepID=A0ABS4I450_9BACL|nr:manganese efflux pump [Paenibacillus aceris]MBP1965695.1 putative sporulation protein YtaF [Paenibacillus aceris]NHW36407.1 sporulation membrane protein YtaF [Paenibacillus aceris]
MHWFSIAVIGVAANIDNLGIGFSFGARSTKVPFISNLLIALLSMTATYLAMSAGMVLSHLISPLLGNFIGGIAIITIGALGLRSSLVNHRRTITGVTQCDQTTKPDRIADTADKDENHIISWVEAISLGFALSLNCIASGLGAGASGVSPLFTAISVGIFSLLSVDIGVRFGYKIAKSWFGKYAEVVGCILLIVIGMYEVII